MLVQKEKRQQSKKQQQKDTPPVSILTPPPQPMTRHFTFWWTQELVHPVPASCSTGDDLDGGAGVGVVGGHHHPSVHGVEPLVVVLVGLQHDVHPVVEEHVLQSENDTSRQSVFHDGH